MQERGERGPLGHRKSILLLGVALSTLVVSSGTRVSAQETTDDAPVRLGNVVVTSSKRETTLQSTPIAVSVVDKEEIEKAQIQDLSDLQTLVPSLTVRQSQSSANTVFFVRGFGNGFSATGLEPSVGIFIDGVYRSRAASAITDLPSLERVEVIRGPQSTLFGKNASAGVISVVTRKPQFSHQGSLEASIGNYDAVRLKGEVTGPISDKVAFALSGNLNQRKGFVEDLGTGDEYNERNRWGVRGELLFVPKDELEIRLIADHDEIDELCCALTNLIEGNTGPIIRSLGGQFVSEDPFSYEIYYDVLPINKIENSGVSLQADYDLGFATLTNIGALRKSSNFTDFDADTTSLELFSENSADTKIDTYTQEIRLTSNPSDKRFDWMIGGFYFDEQIDIEDALIYGAAYRPYLTALIGSPTALPSLESFAGLPPSSLGQAGQGVTEVISQDNTSWSVFSTVDFYVTDRLTATVGLNYTEDKKDVSMAVESTDALAALNLDQLGYTATMRSLLAARGVNIANPASVGPFIAANPTVYAQLQQQALATAQGAANPFNQLRALQLFPPFLDFPNAVEDGKTRDSDTTYSIRFAYDATDKINIYASYATGFKASSWNLQRQSKPFSSNLVAGNPITDPVTRQPVFVTPASPVTNAGLYTVNMLPGTRYAAPEHAEVYEIGIKGSYDKFAFAVTLFDQSIEDFQTTVFTENGSVFANAAKQSATGIEIDTIWNPVKPLTLTFAGTFLDSEYDSFSNFGNGIDVSGATPAGIADTQFTVGANFNFRIGDLGAFVRSDWQYVGDSAFFDDPSNEALIRSEDYSREQNLVNASAGILMKNGVAVSIWSRNLFDDEYIVGAVPSLFQAGSISGFPNQQRTFGVTVTKKW